MKTINSIHGQLEKRKWKQNEGNKKACINNTTTECGKADQNKSCNFAAYIRYRISKPPKYEQRNNYDKLKVK